jgi:hypothetical protein
LRIAAKTPAYKRDRDRDREGGRRLQTERETDRVKERES